MGVSGERGYVASGRRLGDTLPPDPPSREPDRPVLAPAMEVNEGESESLAPGRGSEPRCAASYSGGRAAAAGPPSHSPGAMAPFSRRPDETTVRDASNEQMAISDTDQLHSFLEVEHNSCRYKIEPREQMPTPVSLESDFFVSLKLAAVLTFIFVAVTILLVSSKQNEPLLIHPDLPKFNYQHSLNQKLHKVRMLFPRQSDSFWAALENIFNQLPMDPDESLQARFIGVGHGDSWNTMLCLSKTIVSLLRVSEADPSPDGMNKVLDYSQVLWSHSGSSPRPGTSNVVIAEIIRNHSCTVALSLHAATKPTAGATSLISVWSIKAEPKQEIFPSLVAKVLHHLNQTESSNTDIPNTPAVTVNTEDHLQSGFLC